MPHTVYPYSEPIAIRPNLYQVRGSLPMPVPRNMTVYRSESGALVLYSVIAMHEPGMRALEALGAPAVMVVPHRRHQMDAAFYKQRYPQLRVLAVPAARVRDVQVDGDLSELARFGIDAYELPGNTYGDAVLDLPVTDGRALAVCESLFNVKLSGVAGMLFRVLGPPGGGSFGVARAVRLREIRGASKLRGWLEQQSERSDLRALLFGHGDAITSDVPAALRLAATQV
jgi:hypothetical protein